VGISPAMDLGVSADALHNFSNRVYEWKFLIGLRRRFRRKAELFPHIYSTVGLERIVTLRQFDDQITARYSGFTGADDYYYRASSARVASQISVPTLVVHALDDPFIRMLPSTRAALLGNQRVRLIETAHGGHCAFLAPAAGYDGYWAEKDAASTFCSRPAKPDGSRLDGLRWRPATRSSQFPGLRLVTTCAPADSSICAWVRTWLTR